MKIAVLVSGGVDSSVVLARLHEQGHDVTAFYLKIWLEDETSFLGHCPWEEDLSYIRALCDARGIELRIIPLQKEYHEQIVAYTIAEVKAGRTPSPDVLCNNRIKFGAFLQAIGPEFEKVASGHYGKIVARADGVYELHKSPDLIKDQTYFLSHLSQVQLSRLLLPLGDMTKQMVRAEAARYGVPAAERKDSQGLCFLGKISFADFIKHYLGELLGEIVEEETGTVLGRHPGYWFFTLGQRKALRLSGGPWFVVRKDIQANRVYVSRQYYADDKPRNLFVMSDVHWVSGHKPEQTVFDIKVRHGAEVVRGELTDLGQGRYQVLLEKRDQGLAPGQFAVLYDGTQCLGCGVIAQE